MRVGARGIKRGHTFFKKSAVVGEKIMANAEQFYSIQWPDFDVMDTDFGSERSAGGEVPVEWENQPPHYSVLLDLPRGGFGEYPKAVFSLSTAAVVRQLQLRGYDRDGAGFSSQSSVEAEDFEWLLREINSDLIAHHTSLLGAPRFNVSPALGGADRFVFSVDLLDKQLTPALLSNILAIDLPLYNNYSPIHYDTPAAFFSSVFVEKRLEDVAGFAPIAYTQGMRVLPQRISSQGISDGHLACGFVLSEDQYGQSNGVFHGVIPVTALRDLQRDCKTLTPAVFDKNRQFLQGGVWVDVSGVAADAPYRALLEGRRIMGNFDSFRMNRAWSSASHNAPFLKDGSPLVLSAIHDTPSLREGGAVVSTNRALPPSERSVNPSLQPFLNDGVRLFFRSAQAAAQAGFEGDNVIPVTNDNLPLDPVVLASFSSVEAFVVCPSLSGSPALTTAVAHGLVTSGRTATERALTQVVQLFESAHTLSSGARAQLDDLHRRRDTLTEALHTLAHAQSNTAEQDAQAMQAIKESLLQDFLVTVRRMADVTAPYLVEQVNASPRWYRPQDGDIDRLQRALATGVVMERLSRIDKGLETALMDQFVATLEQRAAQKLGAVSVEADRTLLNQPFNYWDWVERGGAPEQYIAIMDSMANALASVELGDTAAAPWYQAALAETLATDAALESAFWSARYFAGGLAVLASDATTFSSEALLESVSKYNDTNSAFQRAFTDCENALQGRARERALAAHAEKQAKLTQTLANNGSTDAANARRERIDDFGEKIGGAHKDRYGKVSVEQMAACNDMELLLLSSKNALWPALDMRTQLSSGVPITLAMLQKTVKNLLPTEPNDKTRKGCEAFIAAVQSVRDTVMEADSVADAMAGLFVTFLATDKIHANLVLEGSRYNTAFDRAGCSWGGSDPLTAGQKMSGFCEVYRELQCLAFGRYEGVNTHLVEALKAVRNPERDSLIGGQTVNTIALNTPEAINTVRAAWKQDLLEAEAKWTADKPFTVPEGAACLLSMNCFRKAVQAEGKRLVKQMSSLGQVTGVSLRERYGCAYPWLEEKAQFTLLTDAYQSIGVKKKTAEELEAMNKTRQFDAKPHLKNIQREGKDWRNGADVTPEIFTEAFGFRGVEFGEWVTQGERQTMMNMAYDALMDLADVYELPSVAMSLNGTLALAFGSRGRKGAVAHFEPARRVINLTRMSGAGALAHEFAHALDNALLTANPATKDMVGFLSDIRVPPRTSDNGEPFAEAVSAMQGIMNLARNPLLSVSDAAGMGSDIAQRLSQYAISWCHQEAPVNDDVPYSERLDTLSQAVGLSAAEGRSGGINAVYGTVLHRQLMRDVAFALTVWVEQHTGHTLLEAEPTAVAEALTEFLRALDDDAKYRSPSHTTEAVVTYKGALAHINPLAKQHGFGEIISPPSAKNRLKNGTRCLELAQRYAEATAVLQTCEHIQNHAPAHAKAAVESAFKTVVDMCKKTLVQAVENNREAFQCFMPESSRSYQGRCMNADRIVKKGKAYYSTSHEMFARIFESVTHHKLQQRGDINQYLVNGVNPDLQPTVQERWGSNVFVYLTEEEIADMEQQVDAVMAATRQWVLDNMQEVEPLAAMNV
jgi:hypothetical protein